MDGRTNVYNRSDLRLDESPLDRMIMVQDYCVRDARMPPLYKVREKLLSISHVSFARKRAEDRPDRYCRKAVVEAGVSDVSKSQVLGANIITRACEASKAAARLYPCWRCSERFLILVCKHAHTFLLPEFFAPTAL